MYTQAHMGSRIIEIFFDISDICTDSFLLGFAFARHGNHISHGMPLCGLSTGAHQRSSIQAEAPKRKTNNHCILYSMKVGESGVYLGTHGIRN